MEHCKALWALADRLVAHNAPKELATFMEVNGLRIERVSKKKNKYEMAYEVADALLFGKPGPCPICDGIGTLRACYPMTEDSPTVQCHGLVLGGSKCEFGKTGGSQGRPFGAAGVRRERVAIPAELV